MTISKLMFPAGPELGEQGIGGRGRINAWGKVSTCENTNGLLRQYLLKGTDLDVFSQDELDAIADCLNSRPRATHNWHTPLEVFAKTLALASHPPTPNPLIQAFALQT